VIEFYFGGNSNCRNIYLPVRFVKCWFIFNGSSLFSVGKREDREKIWNSGTQEKKPTRKFATESSLMLSNGGSMEAEQSVRNPK